MNLTFNFTYQIEFLYLTISIKIMKGFNISKMLPPKLTLKAARMNRGLSVKEVAIIINKDYQVILGYEKNSENIPVGLLIELSEIYQYPLDYIFLGRTYRLNSMHD